MNGISFVKRALQGSSGGAVPVADDQPLPVADSGSGLQNAGWHYGYMDTPQTAYVLQQAVGAAGNYLRFLTIQPLSETPGDVYLINGDGSPELIYDGTLAPVGVPIRWDVEANSEGGAWALTIGADVKVSWTGWFT